MLHIKGVQAKEEQEALCRLCGVDFKPDCFCYACREDGAPVAICQFRIRGDCGLMYGVYPVRGVQDDEALLLTGRAVFNFLDRCTVRHVKFFPASSEEHPLARRLGFRLTPDGGWFIDLTGFFHEPCKHGY